MVKMTDVVESGSLFNLVICFSITEPRVGFLFALNYFQLKSRGWREPGNKTLQKSRIIRMVLFMRGVIDQEGRLAWQRQSEAGAGRDYRSCSEKLSKARNW